MLLYTIIKQSLVYVATALMFSAVISGCKSEDVVPPAEGFIFSPLSTYQEAYPGSLVGCKFRIKSGDSIATFAVRFRLPGSNDFVSLPQYPDINDATAQQFASFSNFEYSLPPEDTEVDKEIRFKFLATTRNNKTYEKEYVVRMVNKGLRNLRLYSDTVSSYFNLPALDLLEGTGVPKTAPAASKDLVPATVTAWATINGIKFTVLAGFASANGAKFKPITEAVYKAAPSTYATAYNAIAATSEVSAYSTISASPGTGLLEGNKWYMAKLKRNNVFSYVAFQTKKVPGINLNVVGAVTTFNAAGEYIQLEIKK